MERSIDLKTLYVTREYADCMLIALNGDEFGVHRVVLGQYPRLKNLVAHGEAMGGRCQLMVAAGVVDLVVRWLYGVAWPEAADNTIRAKTKKLMDTIGVADVAEKFEIPQMANDAYALIRDSMEAITSVGDGLLILRETTGATPTAVLQKTIIDRALDLAREDNLRTAIRASLRDRDTAHPPQRRGKKRARDDDADPPSAAFEEADSEGDLVAYPRVIKIPKKSGRTSKPTEKAKEAAVPRKKSMAPKVEGERPEAKQTKPELHCVCRVVEDEYMVQCERCEKWFHPGCIGKGLFSQDTYKLQLERAREGDEKYYREDDLSFCCSVCDDRAAAS